MKNKKQLEYKRTIEEFGAILVHRISRPLLYESFTLFFSPTYWRERKTANALHEFSSNVIEERKRTFDGSITTKVDDENFGKKKLAMLDLLLSAKAEGLGIDDQGICEEVDTFLFEVSKNSCEIVNVQMIFVLTYVFRLILRKQKHVFIFVTMCR